MDQEQYLKLLTSIVGGTILIVSTINLIGIIPMNDMMANHTINILVALISFFIATLISYWAVRKNS